MQQLPNIEKTDIKEEFSCLKWKMYFGVKANVSTSRLIQTSRIMCSVTKTVYTSKIMNLI